jgi:hypothetical protein
MSHSGQQIIKYITYIPGTMNSLITHNTLMSAPSEELHMDLYHMRFYEVNFYVTACIAH